MDQATIDRGHDDQATIDQATIDETTIDQARIDRDEDPIESGEDTVGGEELATELLVEEVSIDGLCGVY